MLLVLLFVPPAHSQHRGISLLCMVSYVNHGNGGTFAGGIDGVAICPPRSDCIILKPSMSASLCSPIQPNILSALLLNLSKPDGGITSVSGKLISDAMKSYNFCASSTLFPQAAKHDILSDIFDDGRICVKSI